MKNTNKQRLRCEMRFENNSECCCCCCCCCCCVCALCSTAVIRRPSIDATGARCAVRAWGVLFGVRVARSHAPEPGARLLFSLTARVCSKKNAHTHRAPAAVVYKARDGVFTLPTLRSMILPALATASRWHGFATPAMPLVRAWCGANLLLCEPAFFSLLLYAVRTYAT